MVNQELALIFQEIADRFNMKGANRFKVRAYENASKVIESLGEDVSDIYKEGGLKALEDIPGVGESIGEKIEEYIKKGKVSELEKLRKEVPIDLEDIVRIEGLGPKTAYKLFKSLKIKNFAELEKAAKAGKIKGIPTLGQKSEQNILRGIDMLRASSGRILLGHALPLAEEVIRQLKEKAPIKKIDVAGSIRRRKETIGDIDIVATSSDPKKVLEVYTTLPQVQAVLGKGPTKASVRFKEGLNGDILVVGEDQFGSVLQHFTGGKEHNVKLRQIAINKGYKLNEYGLFTIKDNRRVACRTEEEIYKKLGMKIMPPEIREDKGEIDASLKGTLPKLIGYNDLQGDLQVQTNWTDGQNTIEEMALAAREQGLKYIAITDHTKSLTIAGGLSEKELLDQMKKIDSLNKKIKGIRILKGSEIDILKDGSLDLSDAMLKKLDVVGVSIHSYFGMAEDEMTARIIKAISHPLVNILFHPTGRKLNRREPFAVNIRQVISAAKKNGVALEVNSYIDRLDLRDDNIRMAVDLGAKMVINSDSHHAEHLKSLPLGLAQARRGWAKKSDVLNTMPVEKVLAWFKKK